MTYRDPNDPLPRQAPGTNPPRYIHTARRDIWTPGNIVGVLVLLAIVIGAIAYGMSRGGSNTTAATTGPSATQSAPTTAGQGSSGVGGSTPSGMGR